MMKKQLFLKNIPNLRLECTNHTLFQTKMVSFQIKTGKKPYPLGPPPTPWEAKLVGWPMINDSHLIKLCSMTLILFRCGDVCPLGSYGHLCSEECRCKNGTCSAVDGSCNCSVGFTGAYCDKPCLHGSAGLNCTQHCNCTAYGTCNQFTGKCQ